MTARQRIQRYRTTGGAADLVRVEVLVPAEDRDVILEKAADLRDRHRNGNSWTRRHDALYDEAMRRFKARCMWNANPPRTVAGLRAIAKMLRSNGGMDAWGLAEDIRELVGHAP